MNRQKQRKETSSEIEVGPDARLCDYAIGEDEGYREPHNTLFRQRIKNIQYVAEQHGISACELLVMVNRNNGWVWDTIPWGKFDDIIQMVCTFTSNGASAYQVIDRDFYSAVREEERRMMGMSNKQCLDEILRKLSRVGNTSPEPVGVTDAEEPDNLPF